MMNNLSWYLLFHVYVFVVNELGIVEMTSKRGISVLITNELWNWNKPCSIILEFHWFDVSSIVADREKSNAMFLYFKRRKKEEKQTNNTPKTKKSTPTTNWAINFC